MILIKCFISFLLSFFLFVNSVTPIHYGSHSSYTKTPVRENLNRHYHSHHNGYHHNDHSNVAIHDQYSQVKAYSGSQFARSDYNGQGSTPQLSNTLLPPIQERQLTYSDYISNSNTNQQINTEREQREFNQEGAESQHIPYGIECPERGSGQFPYLMDCRQFLNCFNGRGFIQSCSPGTLFNPVTRECDFPSKVVCASFDQPGNQLSSASNVQASGSSHVNSYLNPKTNLPPSQFGTRTTQVRCERDASGLFEHPYDCTKFLNCANGITYIQSCGPGNVFNPLFKICDWPHNVNCGSKSLTPIDDSNNENHDGDYLEGSPSNIVANNKGVSWNGNNQRTEDFEQQVGHHFTGTSDQELPSYAHRRSSTTTTPPPQRWTYHWERTTTTPKPTTPTYAHYYQKVPPSIIDRQQKILSAAQTKCKYTDENPPWLQQNRVHQFNPNHYSEEQLDMQQSSTSWNYNQKKPTFNTEARLTTTTPTPSKQHHIQPIYRRPSTTSQTDTEQLEETHSKLGTQNINDSLAITEAIKALLKPYISRNGNVTQDDVKNVTMNLLPLSNLNKTQSKIAKFSEADSMVDVYDEEFEENGNYDYMSEEDTTTPQYIFDHDEKSQTEFSTEKNPKVFPKHDHSPFEQNFPNHKTYDTKLNRGVGVLIRNSSNPDPIFNSYTPIYQLPLYTFNPFNFTVSTVSPHRPVHWPYGSKRRFHFKHDHFNHYSGQNRTFSPQRYPIPLWQNNGPTQPQNPNVRRYYWVFESNNQTGIKIHPNKLGNTTTVKRFWSTGQKNGSKGQNHGHHHHHYRRHHNHKFHWNFPRISTTSYKLPCRTDSSLFNSKFFNHRFLPPCPIVTRTFSTTTGVPFNSKVNSNNKNLDLPSWNFEIYESFPSTTSRSLVPSFKVQSNVTYITPLPSNLSPSPTTFHSLFPPFPNRPSTTTLSPIPPSFIPPSSTPLWKIPLAPYPEDLKQNLIPQSTANLIPPSTTPLPPFPPNIDSFESLLAQYPLEATRPNTTPLSLFHSSLTPPSTTPLPPFPPNLIPPSTTPLPPFPPNIDSFESLSAQYPLEATPLTTTPLSLFHLSLIPPSTTPLSPFPPNLIPPSTTPLPLYPPKIELTPPSKTTISPYPPNYSPTSTIKIPTSTIFNNPVLPSTGVLPAYPQSTTPNIDNTFSYRTNFYDCEDESSFACGNGLCIHENRICNGKNDCGNRRDEEDCNHIGYEIRLSSDSGNKYEGRVEVKVYGIWGYICDDKFGMRDAEVLCHELGFPLGASEVRANSFYSPNVNISSNGHPIFLMDEIDCLGNETSLKECDFNGWGVHDCNPEEVVGVVCKIPVMTCPLNYWLCDTSAECIPTGFLCDNVPDCADESDEDKKRCSSELEIRLVGGIPNQEGRLEVKYRGIWGTVCDDDFSHREAMVVCRSLGHGGAAFSVKSSFGPGTGQIWLDQVNCVGNETSIDNCSHWHWGEHNCAHSEDVGIRCTPGPVLPFNELHLPNAISSNGIKSGRAQVSTDSETLDIVYQYQRSSKILPEQCGEIKIPPTFFPDLSNQFQFRVIKGNEAKRGQHPWQATIRVRGQGKSSHWCGAVIISRFHLLTAAHCLVGFPKGAYFIRMGDHNSEVYERSELEIFIENIYIHEDFRKGQHMNNDIALIVLKQSIRFSNYIQPVCMPPKNLEYRIGLNCTISGWGSIESGKSTPSTQLREGVVPILSHDLCTQKQVYGETITEGMFCAGSLDEGVDACDGDSGGPLVCLNNGAHTLYGLISWGQHCGYANRPGVYTKVSYYNEWIHDKLNQSMWSYGV